MQHAPDTAGIRGTWLGDALQYAALLSSQPCWLFQVPRAHGIVVGQCDHRPCKNTI